MTIGVVGGGAIGLLISGYLSQKFSVTLYVRREEQRQRIIEAGITIENGPGHVHVNQVKLSEQPWEEDLIIIAVKQPALPKLLENHQQSSRPGQSILFLQNGVAHLALLDKLNYSNILIGIVEHGAQKVSDTTVHHRGKGEIKVGIDRGTGEHIAPLMTYDPFPFTKVPDWRTILDEKWMVNAVVNPLTALYQVENGRLIDVEHYLKAMRLLFGEVAAILDPPDHEAAWDHVVQVCHKTALNRSSMLQDIEAGRQTEVDAILNECLKRGQSKGIDSPLIAFLLHSLSGKEQNRAGKGGIS